MMDHSSWILVRGSLFDDVRVLRMARCLNRSVYELIGALTHFWHFAEKNTDEKGGLIGWEKEDVDQLFGLPGFCDAMPSDWLEIKKNQILIPEIKKYNSKEARRKFYKARVRKARRAEQKRGQHGVKLGSTWGQVGVKLGSNGGQVTPTEDKTEVKFPKSLDTDRCKKAWAHWITYKKKIGKPYKTIMSENQMLKRWEQAGATRFCNAIEYSVANGYLGIFEEPSPPDRIQHAKNQQLNSQIAPEIKAVVTKVIEGEF